MELRTLFQTGEVFAFSLLHSNFLPHDHYLYREVCTVLHCAPGLQRPRVIMGDAGDETKASA